MRKIHKFCWHLVRIFGQKLKLILNIFRSTGVGASGSKVGCWTCFLQNIQGELFQEKWKESGFMAVSKGTWMHWYNICTKSYFSGLFLEPTLSYKLHECSTKIVRDGNIMMHHAWHLPFLWVMKMIKYCDVYDNNVIFAVQDCKR